MTKEASIKVRSILSISSDLERTADIMLRMSKDIQIGNKKKLVFSDKQYENLDRIFGLVDEALATMKSNLDSPYGASLNIEASINIENEINELKGKLRKKHLKATEKKEYDVKSGIIYKDLFFSAEKLGDHIINVSEAIRGDFGHDDEDM